MEKLNEGLMKPRFRWDGKFVRAIELFIDFILLIISFVIVHIARAIYNGDSISNILLYYKDLTLDDTLEKFLISNILQILITMFFFIVYRTTAINRKKSQIISLVFLSLFISTCFTIIINFLLELDLLSVASTAFAFVVQLVLFTFYKLIAYLFFKRKNIKNVMIFGPRKDIEKYLSKFINYLPMNRKLKCVYYEKNDNDESVFRAIDMMDMVYVTPNTSAKMKNKLLSYCIAEKEIEFCMIPILYEVGITNASLETVDDVFIYRLNTMTMSLEERFFKRLLDIILSLIGLILSIPFFIIIPILMKLFDKGPVIYKQERATINNKSFMLYKFRTMKVNAEEESGAIWSQRNDTRITKLGKYLRKFRLDEIPQLINVLKGEMSIVGPRPERPIFIDQFVAEHPEFRYRVNVKAGITGYAQIYGKYDTAPEDKIRFDLYYIRNYSFWMDIKLILLTIKTIFDKDSTRGVGIPESYDAFVQKLENEYSVIFI